MNKKDLEKLIAKYDQQADKAFHDYQATGATRYDTARRKAEDLADALRMALTAADDHNRLIALRCTVSDWANRIQAMKANPQEGWNVETDIILQEILSTARMHGLCRED